MAIKMLSPEEARAAMDAGARLVDVREADEHRRERIPGAVNVPLAGIEELPCDGGSVVFHCRSGMRTLSHAQRLERAAGGAPAHILDSGIDAWRKAGHATITDRSQPLEIMRQVQIAAGLLVLAGVLLGASVAPAYLALAGFVGAGLMLAGATGWCGMAQLLRVMPWNRGLGA